MSNEYVDEIIDNQNASIFEIDKSNSLIDNEYDNMSFKHNEFVTSKFNSFSYCTAIGLANSFTTNKLHL